MWPARLLCDDWWVIHFSKKLADAKVEQWRLHKIMGRNGMPAHRRHYNKTKTKTKKQCCRKYGGNPALCLWRIRIKKKKTKFKYSLAPKAWFNLLLGSWVYKWKRLAIQCAEKRRIKNIWFFVTGDKPSESHSFLWEVAIQIFYHSMIILTYVLTLSVLLNMRVEYCMWNSFCGLEYDAHAWSMRGYVPVCRHVLNGTRYGGAAVHLWTAMWMWVTWKNDASQLQKETQGKRKVKEFAGDTGWTEK